jgi:DNA-binding LacI/PurR family transcriptional regulator
MKFEKITIKDIAKALGVSTSTVSRALRDSYEIGEDTKRKILEYAEKMNYKPNQLALNLKERSSKSIGIVVSGIANSFFSKALDGIESIAFDKGYNVIITQTHESNARELANVIHLTSRAVDGILISLASETTDVTFLKNYFDQKMPIVFFDRVSNDIDTHKVTCDNFQGAYDAVNHFIQNGYKQIAFLGSAQHLSNTQERYKGYEKAFEKAGLTVNNSHVKFCQHGRSMQEELESALKNILSSNPKPEAILTSGDTLTQGSLRYFKKNKIKIPGDIAVIGFTNQDFAELLNPALTTVSQPAFEIGGYATELLLQLIESKNEIKHFESKKFSCELHKRESVATKEFQSVKY